jgi:hypothetical protein
MFVPATSHVQVNAWNFVMHYTALKHAGVMSGPAESQLPTCLWQGAQFWENVVLDFNMATDLFVGQTMCS